MAVTLTVDRARWRAHVDATVQAFPGLVPVIKGNGYGFGRPYLAELVEAWAARPNAAGDAVPELAVGTVHELADLPAGGPRPLVLTPALARELTPGAGPAVLTVGQPRHVAEIVASRLRPPVMVKLATGMQRFGAARPPGSPRPDDGEPLAELLGAVRQAGLSVHGYAIHPPLAGSSADHADEIATWAGELPAGSVVYVSHLDGTAYRELATRFPDLRWRIRLGTALWHGDKSFLHLEADVIEVRPVRAGSRAGYRLREVTADGRLVIVTAGAAHGVQALPGDVSPFHFERRRLDMLEPPHMHVSMLFVPDEAPCPSIGDRVDLQRPLITTLVDRIVER